MNHDAITIHEYVRVHARITVFEALELVGEDAEDIIKSLVKDGVLSKKDHAYIIAPKRVDKVEMPKLF